MDLFSYYWFVENGRARQKSMAFLEAYKRHLAPFVGQECVIWEIGCGYPSDAIPEGCMPMGGSLGMWRSYLGVKAKIIGIDILPGCMEYAEPHNNIYVEIGDQSDENFLESVITRYGDPSIIIDDGSHRDRHVAKTFEYMFPRLLTGGLYAIEDIAGNHLDDETNILGFTDKSRYIQKCMNDVLVLNQCYNRGADASRKGVYEEFKCKALGFMTKSISFYPNLVVYEKGLNVPFDQMVGPPHYQINGLV
jgi:hypothetical protein